MMNLSFPFCECVCVYKSMPAYSLNHTCQKLFLKCDLVWWILEISTNPRNIDKCYERRHRAQLSHYIWIIQMQTHPSFPQLKVSTASKYFVIHFIHKSTLIFVKWYVLLSFLHLYKSCSALKYTMENQQCDLKLASAVWLLGWWSHNYDCTRIQTDRQTDRLGHACSLQETVLTHIPIS